MKNNIGGIIVGILIFGVILILIINAIARMTKKNQSTSTSARLSDGLNARKSCQGYVDCYSHYTDQLMQSVNGVANVGVTNYPVSVLKDRYDYLQKCLNS